MIKGALLGRQWWLVLPSHLFSVEIGCCCVAKVRYKLPCSRLGLLSAGLSTFDMVTIKDTSGVMPWHTLVSGRVELAGLVV